MQTDVKYHISEARISDEQQVIKAAQKDIRFFEELYNSYYEDIFRFIKQRMDDKEQAFDLTQQVFLKAMLNIKDYTFKGVPFVSWLYRIAYNETISFFRKETKHRTINIDDSGAKDISTEIETPEFIEDEKLSNALHALNDDELTMIEMRFFEKRAFKEIADILNITENSAKLKTYRILDKIKKVLTR